MNCTWVDCTKPAAHPQIGKDGQQWADLCDEHPTEMAKTSDDFLGGKTGPAPMLRCWVRAQGGSKKAAERMMGKPNAQR